MRGAPLGYVRPLDGLRAVSILMVMGAHNMGSLSALIASRFAGWSGVDTFFVVSGFLITSLLTDERDRYGAFSFRKFYLRRILRIAPAYLIFLVALSLWRGKTSLPTFAICLAYVSDYAIALQWSFFDKIFGITWSLSMEEQFYMLWPFALWLGGRRSLMLCLLLIGAVICWRAAVVCSGAPWQRVYFAFDTRFDSILIGCAAALLRRRADSANWLALLGRAPWAAGIAVAASAATLHYFGVSRSVLAWCLRLPFHNALVAIFVVALVEAPTSAVARILAMPVPAFLGRLSYGMYLWHECAFLEVDSIALSFQRSHIATPSLTAQLPTEGAKLVLTVAMAGLSYFAVEKPFLRLKRRVHGSALTANSIGRAPQVESR